MKRLLTLLAIWWSDRPVYIVDMYRYYDILSAAGPRRIAGTSADDRLMCEECGAFEWACSPPLIQHEAGCAGDARYRSVSRILNRCEL